MRSRASELPPMTTRPDDEMSREELRQLRPAPEYVALGYFVVRDGETMVTPKGLAWLRSILPYLDAGSDPSRPKRPQ